MENSQDSLDYDEAVDETEKELKNNLPPWEKSSSAQKLLILLIKLIISVPLRGRI